MDVVVANELLKELRISVNRECAKPETMGNFIFSLAYALLHFFHLGYFSPMDTAGTRFVRNEVLPALEKFSESEEERKAILAELLEYATGLIVGPFKLKPADFGVLVK